MNSISANNYIQLSLLRAYVSTHKFDVICTSETYFDSDTFDNDDNIKIAGYNSIRSNPIIHLILNKEVFAFIANTPLLSDCLEIFTSSMSA